MTITTEAIKELRDATGVSIMQCKKALEEAGGDMEKARVILQEYSKAAADKKADRELGAGTVASYIHMGGNVGVIVELMCETDYVSKNENFQNLAKDIAMHIAALGPEALRKEEVTSEEGEALLDQPFIKDPSKTIQQMLDEAIQKLGEKVEITRFTRYSIN